MINHAISRRVAVWLALACVLVITATPAYAQDDAELLKHAWAAVDSGRFSDAERLLREKVTDPEGPVVDSCAVALEIIRRIRLDYSLTPEQLLDKLRDSIPDVAAEDLERWRQQGVLQHRVIDDQVRYFGSEPSNLFRFCAEARSRRKADVKPAGWRFDLPNHLAQLVAEAEGSGDPQIHPVQHRIRYELRVKEGHPRLRKGARVRCWLPFPQQYRQQRDVRLISTEPPDAVVAPNGCPQRTVYFEQIIGDPSQPLRFAAEFQFVTCAYVPKLDPGNVKPYDTDSALYREYTAERPPHIVFTPELRDVVDETAGSAANPLLRARRIFYWVCENVKYCSEIEYSTIPNISGKALTTRQGDCGVQAMLLITLCRAAGIPARWQSGWETLPNGWNMHDWAEFYVEPWGWLPADPSYGLKKHSDPRVREFYCGHMDAYRMIVNLDYARELHPPKTSFRSESNDFQRGEIEIDGHNLYFDEWSWDFDVQVVPLDGGLSSLPEALDAIVPDLLEEGGIPGAVIAIGRKTDKGYETWQKAYGFLRTEPRREPMPADAIFDLASLTKPIATGTSLMILAERDRLDLDDPVGNHLPEFNVKEGTGSERGEVPVPVLKQDVTVRQLMTHMSGMPAYVGADRQKVIKEKAGFPCPGDTRAYVRTLDLTRPPGEVVIYSCLNAILCAEIVEVVSGQPLDRFAAEHIFKPLKMTDTGFNPPEQLRSRCVPSTKAEHGRGEGGFLQGQVHDPLAAMQAGVSGNAGLFSTAADLCRFAQIMLNSGELDGVRILKVQTVRDMTRIQNPGAVNTKGSPDRRGLLWDLHPPDPGDTGVDTLHAFGHAGYTGTAIRIYPDHGVYVIALTNRVHPDDSGKVESFRQQVWNTVGQALMRVAAEADRE